MLLPASILLVAFLCANALKPYPNPITSLKYPDLTSPLGSAISNGTLRLVHIPSSDSSNGLVSSYNLATQQWTHQQPFNSAKIDRSSKHKVFSLKNNHLFVLTFNENLPMVLGKLYHWNEKGHQFDEIKFTIDPQSAPIRNPYKELSLNVPDQNGNVAYLVVTSHQYHRGSSEYGFSKLELTFDADDQPIEARAKFLAKYKPKQPSSVVGTAVKGNLLYAFVQRFSFADFRFVFALANTLNLNTTAIGEVRPGGNNQAKEVSGDHTFQVQEDRVILVGGRDPGEDRDDARVWTLDLSKLSWEVTEAEGIPTSDRAVFAFDQKSKRLYGVEFEEAESSDSEYA